MSTPPHAFIVVLTCVATLFGAIVALGAGREAIAAWSDDRMIASALGAAALLCACFAAMSAWMATRGLLP